MSLIARVPSNVWSSTSVSPVKRSYGNQNPWRTIAEKEERPGRPDVGIDRKNASDHYYHEQFMGSFSSASYSKWDENYAWSSQEWSWTGWMIRCEKDRNEFSNVTEDGEKHSRIWGMFMTVTMQSAVFMGKNYLNNCQSIVNTTDLRLKQMFDISTRDWCLNEMRSQDWKQLVGTIIHGNTCHWVVTKGLSIFNARRSTSFRILCCALGRFSKTSNRTMHGNEDWDGWNLLQKYRNFDRIDGEPMEFEWNIFPGFKSSMKKSNVYCWDKMRHQRISQEESFFFDDVQWHFLWIKRQQDRMRVECSTRFSF